MKILLVGNYVNSRQQSMQRFVELMYTGLKEAGHEVRLLQPPAILGKLNSSETGAGKWLGYVDRFLLFRPLLRREAAWADLVHICDQANAIYALWLGDKAHLVTCHDMLAVRSALGEVSDNRTRWSGKVYQRWILRGLNRAQHVACGSAQTKEDLLRVTDQSPQRTSIASYGFSHPYHPMLSEEALQRLQILGLRKRRPFFVHVGGNQWYKNRTGVLRIFAELVRKQDFQAHNLAMVGKPWTTEMRQIVSDLQLEDRVVELVEVSNEDLNALYSQAEALIFPSLAEGFGWPVIEAQACGCVVVASGRSPIPEVGGAGAAYFDPEDEAGAAQEIARTLGESDSLRAEGFRNAARYSTAAMVSGYLDLYRSVLGREA